MTSVFFATKRRRWFASLEKSEKSALVKIALLAFGWPLALNHFFLRGKRWEWSYRHPRDVDRLDLDFWNSSVDFSLFHSCVQSLKGV
ncbi:hypothetical protein OAK65_04140 [Synechococcus sp. AH-551-N17]|nr:hypothetical protein [Synechococcus sp. AH-551-N17]